MDTGILQQRPRPHIFLGLPSPTCAEGMVENGSWAALTDAFDVTLVVDSAKPVPGIEAVADSVVRWSQSRNRLVAWQAIYLSHQMAHGRQFHPEIVDTVIWLVGYSRIVTRLRGLIATRLFKAVGSRLLRRYLARTNPLVPHVKRPPDAVVCLTGFKDPMHDDMIRLARDLGIPSFSIPQNWDNIYYKALIERPDRLGVWGMQGYYTALAVHKYKYETTEVVGMSRMDIYAGTQPDQAQAREALGMPGNVPIILYAGASAPFNDFAILDALDGAISSGGLPGDTILLFKPHPRRWSDNGLTEDRLARLTHLRVIPDEGPGAISARDLVRLMRAVDGVISPYSTMSLEAALCGRPSVNVAYNDTAYTTYDWSLEHTLVHLAPLALASWAEDCHSFADVLPATQRMMARIRKPELEETIKRSVAHIVHCDDGTFGSRVVKVVADQLGQGERQRAAVGA